MEGVWGPYYSAMVPGLWLNEGGQSATGKLVGLRHPCLRKVMSKLNFLMVLCLSISLSCTNSQLLIKNFDTPKYVVPTPFSLPFRLITLLKAIPLGQY